MFGVLSSYWNSFSTVLFALIIGASLTHTPTRRRYLIAAACFAIVIFSSVFSMVFLMYYNTGMANAFDAGSFSPLTYVVPVLYLVALVYLALSLFPFMSAEKVRKLIPAFVVLAALWSVWAGPTAASMAFFYLLLWLRVYDLRRSAEELSATHQSSLVT